VRFGLTTRDLVSTLHPYLTWGEGLKLAAQTFAKDVPLSCLGLTPRPVTRDARRIPQHDRNPSVYAFSANAMVVMSAFSAWRESSRVC
jgi:hypothetical protein